MAPDSGNRQWVRWRAGKQAGPGLENTGLEEVWIIGRVWSDDEIEKEVNDRAGKLNLPWK